MDQKRIEAALAGAMYYESSPCVTHGPGPRYVSNGKCCECMKARARKRYEAEVRLLREARGVAA